MRIFGDLPILWINLVNGQCVEIHVRIMYL